MGLVPIVSTPPPSPRAIALSEEIRALVERHRKDHPETNDVDVELALRLASTSRTGTRMLSTAIVLGIGLLVLSILLFIFLGQGN